VFGAFAQQDQMPDYAERKKWWSFQLPLETTGSLRPDSGHPVDYFIRTKLAEFKLQPSAEADRRTLIRRLTFDLTGLPPTPDEVERFEADSNPGAY